MSTHKSHPTIIKRLKRAHGHLASIITMMEGDRACAEVAQQLQAVESAIHSAKRMLIQEHLTECLVVESGAGAKESVVEEFEAIIKYL